MAKTLPCGRKTSTHSSQSSAVKGDWKESLDSYLKKEGLRLTAQRERIAQIALEKGSHFEIQELVRAVRGRFPEISPATVYRNVKTLCDAGLLNETLESRTGVTLYERAHGEHHDHIVCLDCGEIFEFHDSSLEKAQEKAVDDFGFREVRHQHVIYARCNQLKG